MTKAKDLVVKATAAIEAHLSAKFQPIPDYGDLMTVADWLDEVKHGGFIDYDGTGDWATATKCSNIRVVPSDTKRPGFKVPKWATHVVWYNR